MHQPWGEKRAFFNGKETLVFQKRNDPVQQIVDIDLRGQVRRPSIVLLVDPKELKTKSVTGHRGIALRPGRHNGARFCCTVVVDNSEKHADVVEKVDSYSITKHTQTANRGRLSTRFCQRHPDTSPRSLCPHYKR